MYPSENNNQAGKGDMPRPIALSKYRQNYDLIFKKPENQKNQIPLNNIKPPSIDEPKMENKNPA
jgi:hypothetical protein